MWKLHRYYLRELSIAAGMTFLVLFGVVLISLVARGIQKAVGGGLLDAALITLFWALDAFPHLLTISFLIATVLTFARANQDRELVAIRSAGISPRTPMTAAVLTGLLLSILGSLCMHYVLPAVHFRKYRVIADHVRNLILNLGLDEDRIRLPGETRMTFRGRDGSDFVDCTIYQAGDRLQMAGFGPIVRAGRVSIPMPAEGSETLQIVLSDVRDTFDTTIAKQVIFELSLRQISEQDRRAESDVDLVSDQLLGEVLRGVHEQPTAAIYTLNRRCCFALMPALLAPIAFCIALFARDRGRVLALLFGLVPLLLFYAGDVFGAKLLQATDDPLFGWLPAFLLLLAGGPFCWRQLRQ
jgi:lipopolysaccharide export system permease protein